jgi:hypothetical protein
MKKLSPLQRISACVITTTFFAINLFVLLLVFAKEKVNQELFLDFIPFTKQSQLSKILDEGTVKVAIQDNNAYWVMDNNLYKCSIDTDGRIDNENAKKINVFDLSEKEVKNLLSIIDTINS